MAQEKGVRPAASAEEAEVFQRFLNAYHGIERGWEKLTQISEESEFWVPLPLAAEIFGVTPKTLGVYSKGSSKAAAKFISRGKVLEGTEILASSLMAEITRQRQELARVSAAQMASTAGLKAQRLALAAKREAQRAVLDALRASGRLTEQEIAALEQQLFAAIDAEEAALEAAEVAEA